MTLKPVQEVISEACLAQPSVPTQALAICLITTILTDEHHLDRSYDPTA